ncbi:radical SAM protein, partial [Candidatus Omnitrophota bacterium]
VLRKFRKRNPKLVLEEIDYMLKLNKMSHFIFSDDVFTLDKNYVFDLCKELKSYSKKITWEVQTRSSLVDDELLKAMSEAGCTKILFGVESGSERIRNEVVNKKITDEEVKNGTQLCWKHGIEPDWYLMLGFPTETREELNLTVNMPAEARPRPNVIGVHITTPLPGSKIFDDMVNNKELDRNIIDDFANGKLKFENGEPKVGYKDVWPYYVPNGMELNDLKEARAKAYKQFYLNPNYILRRIKKDIFSPRMWREDFRQFMALVFHGRSADDIGQEDTKTEKIVKQLMKYPRLFAFIKRTKVWIQRVIFFMMKLFKAERIAIYNKDFFKQNLKTNVPIANTMVSTLVEYFSPKSVVDVGCGTAEYLAEFHKRGVKIKGYEGSKKAIEMAMVENGFIEKADLREKIRANEKYDLAICFEVAEHIEKKYSKSLVNNLSVLSDKVIFSAAHPGQGGHFHINEQPREFWVNLWNKAGYNYVSDLSEKLKRDLKSKSILSWYYENLMVFQRG